MKKVFLITGGTGFIGSSFIKKHPDDYFYVYTRNKNLENTETVTYIQNFEQIPNSISIDYVINLAGENIAGAPWTPWRKKKLWDSRIETTKTLVHFINGLKKQPKILISASAIGYYGVQPNTQLTESSAPKPCFSHKLCDTWEKEAKKSKIPTYITRFGVVLDPSGGMLALLKIPFYLGFGYCYLPNKSYFSWVARDDVINFFDYIIQNVPKEKVFNVTSPKPVKHNTFHTSLARALNRWNIVPVPVKLLNFILGKLGKELITASYKVLPKAIQQKTKYKFKYENIDQFMKEKFK